MHAKAFPAQPMATGASQGLAGVSRATDAERVSPAADGSCAPVQPATCASPRPAGAVAQGARFALAFDTANEVIAIGVGRLVPGAVPAVEAVASVECGGAPRASNTQLLPAHRRAFDRLRRRARRHRLRRLRPWAGIVHGRAQSPWPRRRASPRRLAWGLSACRHSMRWRGARGAARARAHAGGGGRHAQGSVSRALPRGRRRRGALGGRPRGEGRRGRAARLCAEGGPTLAVAGDALRKYAELFSPCGAFLPETAWDAYGRRAAAGAAGGMARGRGRPAGRPPAPPRSRAAGVHAPFRRRGERARPLGEKRAEELGRRRAGRAAARRRRCGRRRICQRRRVSGGVPLPVVGADAAAAAAACCHRAGLHACDGSPGGARRRVGRGVPAARCGRTFPPWPHWSGRSCGSDAWNEALVPMNSRVPTASGGWLLVPPYLPDGGPADAAAFRGTRPGRADGGLRTEVRGASANHVRCVAPTEALADSLRQPATGGQLAAGGQPAAEGRLAAEGSLPQASRRPAGGPRAPPTCSCSAMRGAGWSMGRCRSSKWGLRPRRGAAASRASCWRAWRPTRATWALRHALWKCARATRARRAFYRALGLAEVGVRPRYYSDREDAVIMRGPVPVAVRDVAGMALQVDAARAESLLARESVRIGTKLRGSCRTRFSFAAYLGEKPRSRFSLACFVWGKCRKSCNLRHSGRTLSQRAPSRTGPLRMPSSGRGHSGCHHPGRGHSGCHRPARCCHPARCRPTRCCRSACCCPV